MATRDYVKRGKRPRKAVQRRKTPSENQQFFKRKVLVTVLLFTFGFIFFLYRIFSQQTNEPSKLTPEKPLVSIPSSPGSNAQTLPPKVTEKWSYFETLENKQVEVEANEQETSERPYLMQCGAYRAKEFAEERKAKIAFQGLESQVKTSQVNEDIWYRVVLGPYDLKRKAESDRNLLRRAGIEPCKIWFWEE